MAEHNTDYVTQKVTPVLEEMVASLLTVKPSNPIPFMIEWLRERNGEAKLAASEKEELI